jgi:restriction system protein
MEQLHSDDVGIYVSTGGFTSDAEELARTHEKRHMLLNTHKLVGLWKEVTPGWTRRTAVSCP